MTKLQIAPSSAPLLKDGQSETGKSSREQRHPLRVALILFGLLIVVWCLIVVPEAWQKTMRREAYLPDLEVQARHSPYDGSLQALLGGRLMEAGEYYAAQTAIHQAVAAGEGNETVWRALAAAVAGSGNRALAIADLRLGLKQLPGSAALQTALGQAQAVGPDVTPGSLALDICPNGAQSLIDLYAAGSFLNGPIAWWGRRHREDSGFTTRQEWAVQQPDNAEAQRLWGLALLRNRRGAEGVTMLQHALTLAPNSPVTNLAMATAWEQQGLETKAALQYLHCLELRPNWPPALLGLGRASEASGVKQNALKVYQRTTTVAPDSVEAWIGLGHAYLLTGSTYDKSVAAFQTALRFAPERTDFFNDYALALNHLSRQNEAEATLRRRLRVAPDDSEAHYLVGMVLMNSNPTPARQDEAEGQTREALRLSPSNPLATIQLAKLLLPKGQVQEAISRLQAALQRDPYNVNAMLLLSRAYGRAGQPDLSDKVAAQANRLFREQQQANVLEDQERKDLMKLSTHQQLAELYIRIGAPAKAQHERDMIRLLQTDPQAVAKAQHAYEASMNRALGKP